MAPKKKKFTTVEEEIGDCKHAINGLLFAFSFSLSHTHIISEVLKYKKPIKRQS
jgi:hypothetical protein